MIDFQRFGSRRSVAFHIHHVSVDEKAIPLMSCVIINKRTGEKRAYDDNLARPKFAVMNPEYTKTLPDYQTESSCVDIMMHTIERYFTNGGNIEVTDVFAEGLLRTVMKNSVKLHQDPGGYDARAEIMWAGNLAHNDLTGCDNDSGDFMSHKLEHELGGMFDMTHGAGIAAIWPSWASTLQMSRLRKWQSGAPQPVGTVPDPQKSWAGKIWSAFIQTSAAFSSIQGIVHSLPFGRRQGIVLQGFIGSGKTCLACALGKPPSTSFLLHRLFTTLLAVSLSKNH